MSIKINAETEKGGAVQLSVTPDVWASYAVSGIDGLPIPELFYASVELPNRKRVQFFVNRESNLIVVDIINKDDKGGIEILRQTIE
jgi:hypothetical protein